MLTRRYSIHRRLVFYKNFLVFVTSLLIRCPTAQAGSYNDSHVLLADLFSDYDVDTRPLIDQNQKIVVNFTLLLSSTIEVHAQQQRVGLNSYVAFSWRDEKLTWNPSDYGGLRKVSIMSNRIWRPYINLQNALSDDPQSLLDTTTDTPIEINNKGLVLWWVYAPMLTTCKLDMTYFPYDKHYCEFFLVIIGHNNETISFRSMTPKPDITQFVSNGEWEIEPGDFQYSDFELPTSQELLAVGSIVKLKRLPGYFVINLLFPTCTLSFLNILVFILPADSGEKIGYSITVLLAVMLQMGQTASFLPTVSDTIPLVTQYLAILTTISIFSAVVTVLILLIHHRQENERRKTNIIISVLGKLRAFKSKLSVKVGVDNQKKNDAILAISNPSCKKIHPFNRWRKKVGSKNPRPQRNDNKHTEVNIAPFDNDETTKTSTTSLAQSIGQDTHEKDSGTGCSLCDFQDPSPLCSQGASSEGKDAEKTSTPCYVQAVSKEESATDPMKNLSSFIDRICFIFFSLVWLCVTIGYFVALFS